MKGLLVKDMCLMLQRKQTLLLFLIISVVMSFTFEGSFIVIYASMLMMIAAMGTISYDEFDNGFPFLFSLPIDCKTYVMEKYSFCFGMELVGMIAGLILMFVSSMVTGKPVETDGLIAGTVGSFLGMAMVCAVLIHVQLKYGIDKSRLVLFGIYGVIALVLLLFTNYFKAHPIAEATGLVRAIVDFAIRNPALLLMIIVAVLVGIIFVMYAVTVRMMEKKEF